MCLGVPGQILSITQDESGLRLSRVTFGGIVKEVSLAYTPEAQVGDYVVVHVGFALNVVDEDEALKVFAYLKAIDELQELEIESESAGAQ